MLRISRALACAVLLIAVSNAHAQSDDAQRKAQQVQTQQKLDAVRAQIAQLAASQRATAAQRDQINATLATQAQQLNDASRALHDTDAAIEAKSQSLAQLQDQRAQLESRLSGQREALAQLLRAAYALDRGGDLSLLLGDEDVSRIARALAYSRYFQHDRVQRIRELLSDVAKLDQVKQGIESEQAALRAQREQRAQQAQALEQARDAQQKLLAQADAQLAQQKDQLAALQRQQQDLNQLLEKLKDVFADIPKQLGGERPFAQLKGDLPWPATGAVHAGTGVLEHGVLVAARPGTAVHAVAYGRVAWADFMRGFGELVIVDHGGGYMSLYGGNEAALVEVGDWVKPGQAIATVGRGPQQGAYFELRKDGKPVDAKEWLKSR
ncbi:MAG TPA: peptidoglycan DD-metalloendopeptidase family protein [Rhodanobacteraceae bacterium]|nr:peptidoglycan DD-metalloendopeptidase family protein [Rhodanobacteraceae bacterium]